jgi:hypothetical protein
MTVTNVRWTLDRRGRRVLDLDLDGHPAHIHSSQKTELLQRGTVDGMVFFASERAAQVPNIHIRGGGEAASAGDLIGVTNDPQVFALYQDMAAAIRRDTWRAGPRPAPVAEPRRDRQAPRRTTAPSTPRSATSSHRGVAE